MATQLDGSNFTVFFFLIIPRFYLRFAAGTVAQSSAHPCDPPGPSGAVRRSPHHPWDRELCCAGPPACPGPEIKRAGNINT